MEENKIYNEIIELGKEIEKITLAILGKTLSYNLKDEIKENIAKKVRNLLECELNNEYLNFYNNEKEFQEKYKKLFISSENNSKPNSHYIRFIDTLEDILKYGPHINYIDEEQKKKEIEKELLKREIEENDKRLQELIDLGFIKFGEKK